MVLAVSAVLDSNYNYLLIIIFFLFSFSPVLYLSFKTFDIYLEGDFIFIKNITRQKKIHKNELKVVRPVDTFPLFISPYFKLVLHSGETYFFPWHKVNLITFLRDRGKVGFKIREEISAYFD